MLPSFVSGFLRSCIYTVRDQAVRLPGSTSLLSFISVAAVFPHPSLRGDRGSDGSDRSDPLREGLPEQWPGAGLTRDVGGTLLLPSPETEAGRQPAPEKVHAMV